MLNAVGQTSSWVRIVQSFLLIGFLVGAAAIVMSRFPPDDRRQLRLALTPSLLAVAIGLLFPQYLLFFALAAIGWLFMALVIIRGRVGPEYHTGIKHMRNTYFDEACRVMTDLIK